MREELEKVRNWANDKIASGQEPPMAWFQYMKLRETCDEILSGMSATTPLDSPESQRSPGERLRLVDSTDQPGTVQHHPVGLPVRLPM